MAENNDKTPSLGLQGQSYLYDYGTSPNTRTAVSQKVRILTPVYGDNNALHQMGVVSSFAPTQSRSVEPVRGIGFGDKIAELVPSVTEPTTGSFERALLYLCNLWQAAGYASGVDGPVRSLAHHRWPFDIEQQLVFSTLADTDVGVANTGYSSGSGEFDGGVKTTTYPTGTTDGINFESEQAASEDISGSDAASNPNAGATAPGHTAIITMYEACWFTGWNTSFAKDAGMIMETGEVMCSDVHDFSSLYGEFLATGNDPTIGQLGSVRFHSSTGTSQSGAAGSGGQMFDEPEE
jgi:hypothetical protein